MMHLMVRRQLAGVGCLVLSGFTFGWLTSAANHGLVAGEPHMAKVLGNDWAWLAAAFLAALPAHRWAPAFRRGMQFLMPAVLAYYVTDAFAGTYSQPFQTSSGTVSIDALGLVADVIAYLVIGTLTAAGIAVLVTCTRRGSLWGPLAALVLPAYFVYSGFGTARVSGDDAALHSVATWVGIVGLVSSSVVLLFGAKQWLRGEARSVDPPHSALR